MRHTGILFVLRRISPQQTILLINNTFDNKIHDSLEYNKLLLILNKILQHETNAYISGQRVHLLYKRFNEGKFSSHSRN